MRYLRATTMLALAIALTTSTSFAQDRFTNPSDYSGSTVISIYGGNMPCDTYLSQITVNGVLVLVIMKILRRQVIKTGQALPHVLILLQVTKKENCLKNPFKPVAAMGKASATKIFLEFVKIHLNLMVLILLVVHPA